MSSTSSINSLLSSTTSSTQSVSLSSMLAAESGTSTAGIDVTSAVAAAIYADRAPERVWQADVTTLSSQTTALTAIQTASESLATDLQNLNTLTGPLAARTVASSDSSVLTATAATGTKAGTHTVVITNPATIGSWYSDLETSPTATLSTGTFTITPTGGQPVSIATGTGQAGDNLTDLATAINSATTSSGASLGVTATVVSDATGSRLAIIANSSGTAADFSVATPNFQGNSWTSADMPTGSTLAANSVTLTSSAGTATITTTSGETYAQLATAINNATAVGPPTSYSSGQTSLTSSTPLSAGSVTTIKDASTGKTFSFTATSTSTVGDLNTAIATAVSNGTLSADVSGSLTSGGTEVISEGSTDQGITVSTNDAVLGTMTAAPGLSAPLGLTATANTASNGTSLTIAAPTGSTFTINEPALGFTQANAAENAELTVDGVPVQSGSNTVTGAIPGVTLNLLGSSDGAQITLTVASDATQASTAINQFVSDYNTALGLINTQFKSTSTTSSSGATTTAQGVLASDPTVVSLQATMEEALSYVAKPASGTTTTVSSLADLGITVGNDGTLSVDSTTLDNALTNNPTDVQNFFEGAALNGFANSFYNSLNTFTSPADGAFQVDLTGITASSTSLTSQISNFETGYIASQQTSLTADFSAAEIALQQLPEQMQQLNAELGFNNNSSNG